MGIWQPPPPPPPRELHSCAAGPWRSRPTALHFRCGYSFPVVDTWGNWSSGPSLAVSPSHALQSWSLLHDMLGFGGWGYPKLKKCTAARSNVLGGVSWPQLFNERSRHAEADGTESMHIELRQMLDLEPETIAD